MLEAVAGRVQPLDCWYFDIENEPTSFRERFPLTKPIAIGWEINGKTNFWAKNHVWRRGGVEPLELGLERFRDLFWDVAPIVAGHNVRQHDNPIVNGARMRVGLKPLAPRMCRDTLRDLIGMKGVGRSLEALTIYLGIGERKHHLSEAEWEELWPMDTPARREEVIERCLSDVALNVEIGAILQARGYLKPPRMWRP